VVIEAYGSTNLAEVGNNFYLYTNGSGPELKYSGAAVVAGQFGGAWTPYGAEQTAGGYEVAWKNPGADQYTVWNTDSSGNYVSDTIGIVSGASTALESLETSFHQDLNGDGVIGVPTVVIEAYGSTNLAEVGNNFYLYTNGSGPELKYNGAAVVAGQFGGAWTPFGAEQTAGGYEVAWKNPGANQYTVWNTDSSGNYVSDTIGIVSGASTALEALETSFHQDLNGDGVIGVPSVATSANVTQSISVMIGGPNNDAFIFHPGVGEEAIVNAASADKSEFDVQSASDINLTKLLNDAQTNDWHALYSTNGGQSGFGNDDNVTVTSVHISDLHASNFIIH
jgi:20S proteasome alpha/beta subunit